MLRSLGNQHFQSKELLWPDYHQLTKLPTLKCWHGNNNVWQYAILLWNNVEKKSTYLQCGCQVNTWVLLNLLNNLSYFTSIANQLSYHQQCLHANSSESLSLLKLSEKWFLFYLKCKWWCHIFSFLSLIKISMWRARKTSKSFWVYVAIAIWTLWWSECQAFVFFFQHDFITFLLHESNLKSDQLWWSL